MLKLHEIIEANEGEMTSILTESLHPYRKSLYKYYKDEFCQEPVLMVTSVTNATAYAKIVPATELDEAITDYITADSTEEFESERESIMCNSIMLSSWV